MAVVLIPKEQSSSTTTTTTYYSTGGKRVALAVNGAFSYLDTDGLGSASVALDGSGSVQASVLYGPYGAVRYSSGTMPGSSGYTGQHADATTGLDYYNARYYDASAGQFASADTARDGLNRYGYVHGNPTTLTDPSGHMAAGGCFRSDGEIYCPPVTPESPSDNGGGGIDYYISNPHPCGGNWTPKQCQEGHSARLAAAIHDKVAAHVAEALLGVYNMFWDFKQFQADLHSGNPIETVGDVLAMVGDGLAIFSGILTAFGEAGVNVVSIQKWVDAGASALSILTSLYKTFRAATGFWLQACEDRIDGRHRSASGSVSWARSRRCAHFCRCGNLTATTQSKVH